MKRVVVLLSMFWLIAPVQGAGLELDISEESGELTWLLQSGGLIEGGMDVGLGFFYNRREDLMGSATLLSLGQQAKQGQPLQLGVGAKLFLGQLSDDSEVGAIALGARIGYIYPSQISPIVAVAETFFAPSVTNFGDAERVVELTARLEMEITPSAVGFFGYRLNTVRLADTEDDAELDDNMHIGVRFIFPAPRYRR